MSNKVSIIFIGILLLGFSHSNVFALGEVDSEPFVPVSSYNQERTFAIAFDPLDWRTYFSKDIKIFPFSIKNNSLLDTSADKRKLISSVDRSHFENQVIDDYPEGKIIVSSKKTRIEGANVSLSASVNQVGQSLNVTGTNYGALLLILLMLAIIVVLARLTFRKGKRVESRMPRYIPQRHAPQPFPQGRYSYQHPPHYNHAVR